MHWLSITTVGYGDKYPITAVGCGIAVFLMFAGIALFGYLTANIASLKQAPTVGDIDLRQSELDPL